MNAEMVIKGCKCLGVAMLGAGLLTLSVTNPGKQAYENFAIEQILSVLRNDVCSFPRQGLSSQQVRQNSQCATFSRRGEADIRQFFIHNTQRKDFVVCSVYTTELPVYSLRVIGIYNHFFLLSITEA